ncbi:hypothetical protein GIV75_29275 [Pseudomonas sp. PA-3-5D]|uniref:hypothetical protein n=3 Tax=Pseudomonas TaxID=286 RepID=UPI001F1D8C81|nr:MULTISPECIES: hypothetical protein [unclassified Pseudomonas]MCF5511767.1 hypothetical protein [Pseudomonas sp. PA-3-6H]MCF5564926.1 hypothetical protein [Pseudomonas sp. PA-3-5D]
MNLKEQNSVKKRIIYTTSKFWSVNGKSLFNATISEQYGVDALTAKKAAAYLIKEKAICEGHLADLKNLPHRRNWFGVKKPHSGIAKLIAFRNQITASLNKLNAMYEYDLVILNHRKSGNGADYAIETYSEFMNKFVNIYKVKEITEEEFSKQKAFVTREKKIRKYNDIFFFWWFIATMIITVTFEKEITQYLNQYDKGTVVIITLGIITALIKLPLPTMRKFIKPA